MTCKPKFSQIKTSSTVSMDLSRRTSGDSSVSSSVEEIAGIFDNSREVESSSKSLPSKSSSKSLSRGINSSKLFSSKMLDNRKSALKFKKSSSFGAKGYIGALGSSNFINRSKSMKYLNCSTSETNLSSSNKDQHMSESKDYYNSKLDRKLAASVFLDDIGISRNLTKRKIGSKVGFKSLDKGCSGRSSTTQAESFSESDIINFINSKQNNQIQNVSKPRTRHPSNFLRADSKSNFLENGNSTKHADGKNTSETSLNQPDKSRQSLQISHNSSFTVVEPTRPTCRVDGVQRNAVDDFWNDGKIHYDGRQVPKVDILKGLSRQGRPNYELRAGGVDYAR